MARIKLLVCPHNGDKVFDFGQVSNIVRIAGKHIERGDKAPGLDTLINIANTLTVPADELLVDNLTVSNSKKDGDDYYILLDCTPEEATILVKNMKDLREILRKYTVK